MKLRSRTVRRWARLGAVILIIAAMSYSFIYAFKGYVESKKREQARYNLEHAVHCLTRVHKIVHNLGEDSCDNSERLDRAIWDTCTRGMRTSPTGDVYVLNKLTKRFVFDTSNDIPTDEELYFTKESVGKFFQDWDSASKAVQKMTTGNDSTDSDRVSYNYDGAPEWLEWKLFTHDEITYVVVQGTQSDEVYAGMLDIEYKYYVFMLIVVMILVLEVNAVPYDRRRTDGD